MKLLRGVRHGNPTKRKRFEFGKGKACYWCGRAVKYYGPIAKVRFARRHADLPDDAATREHIYPASKGGRNGKANIVVACRKCNRSRGARTDWEPYQD